MTLRIRRAVFVCSLALPLAPSLEDVCAAEWACSATPEGGWNCRHGDAPAPPASPTGTATPTTSTSTFAIVDPATSDWKARSELSAAMLQTMPAYCTGMYVEPSYPLPLSSNPASEPLRASGGSVEYWIDDRAVLSRDVKLTQGNRSLVTPSATLDIAHQRAKIDQGLLLREPGFAVRARTADVNLETGEAQLGATAFVLYENRLRGEAQGIAKDSAGNLTMTKGYFTRCEPGSNGWRVTSSSVQIDKGAVFGTAHDAVMRVHNVPVLYTPFIKFPVTDERVSGFLLPNIGYSGEDGLDIGTPYYFNLAPNYDATVTPRNISERGPGMEAEFRHMSRWEQSAIGAAFLYDDDRYDGRFSRDEFEELNRPGEFKTENRWLLSVDHRGTLGNVRTFIDYGAVSDADYFGDLGTDLQVKGRVDLGRTGSVEWARDGMVARLWAQRFQNLDPDRPEPYERLPEVLLRKDADLGPFRWSLGGTWSEFDRHNENFGGISRIVGSRSHFDPRISLPLIAPWGFATTTVAFRYTLYNLERVPTGIDETPEREIWMGSADGGLYFDRDTSLFGRGLVQTLEPRVYYLFQDFADQSTLPNFDASGLTFSFDQLFRENRFSGVDRIGDANQTSVGVTTRFLDAATSHEYFRASVGQILYLDDRKVTLAGAPSDADEHSRSSFAGELTATIFSTWRLSTVTVWDARDSEFDEVSFGATYLHDNRHIFNMAYRYVPEDPSAGQPERIDQFDVAGYWPVSDHWSLLGRWNYDLDKGWTIEAFAGIEYSDCCWQFRAIAQQTLENPGELIQRNLERERGVFLQVVFRGLAGVGNKVDSLMEHGIKGYLPELER
jgi:LPS-assembly protein